MNILTKSDSVIVKYLSEKDGYTTANELSSILGVSTKTIKRAIGNINLDLKDYNVNIISSRGLGYILEGSKKDVGRIHLKAESMLKYVNNDSLETRVNSIICMLINNDYVSVEEISEELNLSMASTNKVFSQMKKTLSNYNLSIKSKPCYGSFIIGSEYNLRKLIMDYAIKINGNEKLKSEIDNIYDKEIELIETIIIKNLKAKNTIISDKDFNILLSKIIISVSRNRKEKRYIIDKKQNFKDKDHSTIIQIIREVDILLGIKLNEDELVYICSHLNRLDDKTIELKVSNIIKSSLGDIYLISGTDYKDDKEFINSVSVHIHKMVNRTIDELKIENPLIYQVKNNFPVELNLAIFLSKNIEKEFNISITEEEISYIAIHFAASSERLKKHKLKNICIICHYGIGTGQLLAEKFKQTMNDVNIIGVYPVKYLDLALKEDIDFIVSTTPLKNINKQVIYIDNIFSEEMIKNIKSSINEGEERKRILTSMFYNEAFFNIDAISKEEAIEIMGQKMMEKGFVSKESINKIIERESMGSTETGNLVAIPHTIMDEDKKSIIGVGILNNPITWEKQEVQLVFMVFLNKNQKQNAPVFRYLYNFIKDIGGVKSIIKFCDFNKLIDTIS